MQYCEWKLKKTKGESDNLENNTVASSRRNLFHLRETENKTPPLDL